MWSIICNFTSFCKLVDSISQASHDWAVVSKDLPAAKFSAAPVQSPKPKHQAFPCCGNASGMFGFKPSDGITFA